MTLAPKGVLKITVAMPPYELSPNARCHWRVLAKQKKIHKWSSIVRARDAIAYARGLPYASATIKYEAFYPAKPWDDDNLIAAMKYARDAFATVGIVPNDNVFTTLPVVSHGYDKNPRVEVTITEN
jgi:Holliday junction resolvase RusA-like endonuclease